MNKNMIISFIWPIIRKYLILFLMDTAPYRWFIQKVVPKIRFSLGYTKLEGVEFKEGYSRLRKGDIILSVDYSKGTTSIIGGEWAHASLCVARDEVGPEIVEMVADGYKEVTFFDICKEADRVAIIRCDDFDPEYIENVLIPKALSFSGTPYDIKFQFESGLKALYCSELVYEADVEKRLDVNLEDLMGLGRKYLSPTGLWKSGNCSKIWISPAVK